jgi:outer membrane protein assembly factor BamB
MEKRENPMNNSLKTLLLGACMSGFLLSACESTWFGEDNEVPLEGERIPLFENSAALEPETASIDVSARIRDDIPMRDVSPEEARAIAATEAALREMESELRADPLAELKNQAEDLSDDEAFAAVNANLAGQARQEAQENVAEASVIDGFIKPPVWPNEFWPQAGGYGQHTMQHVAFAQSGTPTEIWSANVGSGASKKLPLTAAPVVADDKVFTMDSDNDVKAFDVNSGKELWSLNIRKKGEDDEVIGGGLAFSSGLLFATNGYNEVVAIDPYEGNFRWRTQISGPSRAAPSAITGSGATAGRVFVTTLDNKLIALNSLTGEIVWDHQGLTSNAGLLGSASAAVTKEIAVPAYSSGEIYALNVKNGGVAWSNNLGGSKRGESVNDIRALPVIDKGYVFAMSYGGALAAIDERRGETIWQQPIGGTQTPWLAGNRIFVIDKDMKLYALNRGNGAVVWANELPAFENMKKRKGKIEWYGPILAGNRLMAFANNGDAVIIDPVTGQKQTEWETGLDVTQPPVIAGGRLFLLGTNGEISVFR